MPVCLSRDGGLLIATAPDPGALYVWDLRLLRTGLRELGMDWDGPEFPPASGRPAPAVELRMGALRYEPFTNRQAVVATTLATVLGPVHPDVYLRRGLALDRLGQTAAALADYELFLSRTPADEQCRPEVSHRRAVGYYKRKDVRRAAAALMEAAAAPPELLPWPRHFAELCNLVTWELLARAATGPHPDSLLRLAHAAAELEPHNPLYQNTLGVALYRLGHYEEAARRLEANLKTARASAAAYDLYFLAMCHHHLGRPDQARDCLHRAKTIAEPGTGLSPTQLQELDDFRAEAELLIGRRKRQ
jgi:tetratricopeptide (TPR) repeat protein